MPGRIEFLGKHTDYAGGRSLLCAAERGFAVVAAPRTDASVEVRDARSGQRTRCHLSVELEAPRGHWSSYPITVARRFARNFGPRLRGVDMAFASDLPSAAGLSSSSALMIATYLALADANELRQSGAELRHAIGSPQNLAGYLAAVENGSSYGELEGDSGVGTQGGSQDHTAILCSRPRHLVQYHFTPVRFERWLPFPDDCVLVVAASGVLAAKTSNALEEYNRAAARATLVVDVWRDATHSRARTLSDMLAEGPRVIDEFRSVVENRHDLRFPPESLVNRIEQFRVELGIIRAVGDRLSDGEVDSIGALIEQSQATAESLLGNQVPETISLARSARELGALAASAFGAGFGGSVYALVRADAAAEFTSRWAERYAREFPERRASASFFITRAGPPATRL